MESSKINRLLTKCVMDAQNAACHFPAIDFRVYLESKLFDELVFSVKTPGYSDFCYLECELKAMFKDEPHQIRINVSRECCESSIARQIEMMIGEFARYFVIQIGLG